MLEPTGNRRSGYSLVEVLFATAITSVVLAHTVVALVSSQRVMEATMADIELSIQARALREKLLYSVNEDGGLMNVSNSDLSFLNEKKGWGDGISYKAAKGPVNRIRLGAKKKLESERGRPKWLECGTVVISDSAVFGNAVSNGAVHLNLSVSLPIRSRTYTQQQQATAQIMNE